MPKPVNDLSLRSGLPEHLQEMVRRYPREGWEGHANFDGLTRFWLDRHLMFRKVMGQLQDGAEQFLDGNRDPMRYAADTGRLAGFFLNQLHGHHQIEDQQYFPMLSAHDAKLVEGFALLDSDHLALDGHIQSLADRTNAMLHVAGQAGMRDRTAELHTALSQFHGFLNRHLEDEEDLVVPVILHYGAPL